MTDGLDQAWIVHHSHDLLVLNKPSGLLCQPGLGPELADSLISRVQRHWLSGQLVHRLDRDISGLILVALTPELHRALSGLFAERRVHKRYVADVCGVPEYSEGLIELPIAKRQHRPPLYGLDPVGKACATRWRLLGRSRGCSRLELEPLTGRSHQLRVHLQAIGHPILGDPLYGPDASASLAAPIQRLHLHAGGLGFTHPSSGQPLQFTAPTPFELPSP
ncbi:MAG: RluA family pseudouridine synthase [Cyanobacteria bacterium K_DeepCast_35m_m1_288]|nr:RluA family pseudouridine synthase [Cyanobacteria bacterium K_DeepCast_35m_m1_288]